MEQCWCSLHSSEAAGPVWLWGQPEGDAGALCSKASFTLWGEPLLGEEVMSVPLRSLPGLCMLQAQGLNVCSVNSCEILNSDCKKAFYLMYIYTR